MSKQKLTDWFPANVKPVHVGYYERDYGDSSLCNDYWNGTYFEIVADNGIHCGPTVTDLPWRGLSQKTKAKDNS